MALRDMTSIYYKKGMNCALSTLLGANDYYQLGLSEQEIMLFKGFGGGMGCGSTCGCLAGAIGVLSRMFSAREDFRQLCAKYVKAFKVGLGCNSGDCALLKASLFDREEKCIQVVLRSSDVLEAFIAEIQN